MIKDLADERDAESMHKVAEIPGANITRCPCGFTPKGVVSNERRDLTVTITCKGSDRFVSRSDDEKPCVGLTITSGIAIAPNCNTRAMLLRQLSKVVTLSTREWNDLIEVKSTADATT